MLSIVIVSSHLQLVLKANEEQDCIVCISIIKTRRIPSEKPLSKDGNHVPRRVFDVFVDGEDEHEHEEEASAAKEVPDIKSW